MKCELKEKGGKKRSCFLGKILRNFFRGLKYVTFQGCLKESLEVMGTSFQEIVVLLKSQRWQCWQQLLIRMVHSPPKKLGVLGEETWINCFTDIVIVFKFRNLITFLRYQPSPLD